MIISEMGTFNKVMNAETLHWMSIPKIQQLNGYVHIHAKTENLRLAKYLFVPTQILIFFILPQQGKKILKMFDYLHYA